MEWNGMESWNGIMEWNIIISVLYKKIFMQGQQQQKQQHQKQSGGYQFTPSKSRTTKRRDHPRQNPLQNPEQLHKIMALFQ